MTAVLRPWADGDSFAELTALLHAECGRVQWQGKTYASVLMRKPLKDAAA